MEPLLMELWRNADPVHFPPNHEQKQLYNLKGKGTSVLLKERCLKSPKLETKKK